VDLGLRDRACLVTGSTDGIGLAVARLLVEEGARVVTCGRTEAPGIGEGYHVQADLGMAGEPERAVEESAQALGGLDVLVNNVGIARQAKFEEVPDEEWDAYWQLNVMSYVRAIRAALPHLLPLAGFGAHIFAAREPYALRANKQMLNRDWPGSCDRAGKCRPFPCSSRQSRARRFGPANETRSEGRLPIACRIKAQK